MVTEDLMKKTLLTIIMLVLTSCTCPDKKTNDEILSLGHNYTIGCEEGVYDLARSYRLRVEPSLVTINCMTLLLRHAKYLKKKNEINKGDDYE